MGKAKSEKIIAEHKLQRAMALSLSKEYCEKNHLSFDKLKSQRFDFMYDIACFSQPSDVVPLGLTNDRDTMPIPTLIIRAGDDDGIVIERTEHTEKYLGK